MKVTGETITDEQIRELREGCSEEGAGLAAGVESYGAATALNMCDEALGDLDYGDTFDNLPDDIRARVISDRRAWNRSRLADVWNARHGGES